MPVTSTRLSGARTCRKAMLPQNDHEFLLLIVQRLDNLDRRLTAIALRIDEVITNHQAHIGAHITASRLAETRFHWQITSLIAAAALVSPMLWFVIQRVFFTP